MGRLAESGSWGPSIDWGRGSGYRVKGADFFKWKLLGSWAGGCGGRGGGVGDGTWEPNRVRVHGGK